MQIIILCGLSEHAANKSRSGDEADKLAGESLLGARRRTRIMYPLFKLTPFSTP